ncbi:cell division protein FtsZ [Patescibacteria group bacterium]|nr:cell division protein FtsZ [Patescibacteria group bacterium]
MPEIKPEIETFAKIKVIGIGGSGSSAVNRMINAKIRGVEFIVMNTDVQALHSSLASKKVQLGQTISRGLGAGMDPDVGARAAEESQNDIREALKGADMVFITCGLGGGTGSGAAPKVAEIAREIGILTVAVVTRPFQFEGYQRKNIADGAYEKLIENVDTIITIPNDRILQIIDRKTSMLDAFDTVDDVLRQGVQGISDIISVPGLINVDFADARSIMENRGSALMGIGKGHGENRATDAAKAAIASPLLEVSIDGAKGILFTVTGGSNLGMYEVTEAAKVITESTDPQARIIFGAIIDESLKDEVKVTVMATGFSERGQTPKVKTGVASGVYSGANESIERLNFQKPRPNIASRPDNFSVQRTTQVEQEEQQEDTKPRSPQPQPSLHQPHVQPPIYAPVQQASPAQAPHPRVPNEKQESGSEEEAADIPAWFRKKMM